jgi:hypothetical protein
MERKNNYIRLFSSNDIGNDRMWRRKILEGRNSIAKLHEAIILIK